MTIAEAFAQDDVVDEFVAEKKAMEERDKPKDIDLTLPGNERFTIIHCFGNVLRLQLKCCDLSFEL